MNFNPPYPTVEPKTVCEDIREYGSWMIVSDKVSEEKEDEIRRLQEKCIQSEKNPFLIKPNPTPPPPSPLPPIPTPHPPFKSLDDKRYNKCMNHMSEEFKKLNKYCMNPDRSPLNMMEMSHSFCTTGDYNMYCAQPNGFGMERVTGKCEEKKQLNFCGLPDKNKKLSCMPCNFDRTEFETDLHYGYLKKKCGNAGNPCKSKGLVPDKSDIYRQRVINRGFNDRWYSDIDILSRGDTQIFASRSKKPVRNPSLKPSENNNIHGKILNDAQEAEANRQAGREARERQAIEQAEAEKNTREAAYERKRASCAAMQSGRAGRGARRRRCIRELRDEFGRGM